MKKSRRRGATLGLVAASVLVIIVLGVGVFFLCKMFGGGKEVANATDAGTLNLTKQALTTPSITLPSTTPSLAGVTGPQSMSGAEFISCGWPPPASGQAPSISLFTYNRCVAQALIIAINAQAESTQGSASSIGNAQQVYDDLQTYISQPLQAALVAGGTGSNPNILQQDFSSGANKNNVHMFGDTTVNPTAGYQVAYMTRTGSNSTNVAVDPTILPTMPSGNLASSSNGQSGAIVPDGNFLKGYFMGGYTAITVAGMNFYGVPVYPGQQPHLVAGGDFKNYLNPPTAIVPPNSFMMAASAEMGTSGRVGGALASAIVGAVAGSPYSAPALGSNNGAFAAAIPGGYLELANLPGTVAGANFQAINNADSIFNNELGAGNLGTPLMANTDGSLFAIDNGTPASPTTEVADWVAYNTNPATAPNPLTMTPPIPKIPGNIWDANGNLMDLSTLTTMPAGFTQNCTAQAQTVTGLEQNTGVGWNTSCWNLLQSGAFENAFGRATQTSGTPSSGISAVDWAKGDVIANFNSGYHPQVTISSANIPYVQNNTDEFGRAVSGMGVYAGSTTQTYPSPGSGPFCAYPTEQQTTGLCTVWQMINQVDHGDGHTAGSGPAADGSLSTNTSTTSTNGQGCSTTFTDLLQRARQIQPTTTASQLQALLQSSNAYCPIGTTLYINLPVTSASAPYPDTTQPLQISQTKPSTYTGTTADGVTNAPATSCWNQPYPLIGTIVDVSTTNAMAAGVSTMGDDALHAQPYIIVNGTNLDPTGNGGGETGSNNTLTGQDSVAFTLSSGYGNLLGRMEFANNVTGSATFSAPN